MEKREFYKTHGIGEQKQTNKNCYHDSIVAVEIEGDSSSSFLWSKCKLDLSKLPLPAVRPPCEMREVVSGGGGSSWGGGTDMLKRETKLTQSTSASCHYRSKGLVQEQTKKEPKFDQDVAMMEILESRRLSEEKEEQYRILEERMLQDYTKEEKERHSMERQEEDLSYLERIDTKAFKLWQEENKEKVEKEKQWNKMREENLVKWGDEQASNVKKWRAEQTQAKMRKAKLWQEEQELLQEIELEWQQQQKLCEQQWCEKYAKRQEEKKRMLENEIIQREQVSQLLCIPSLPCFLM